MPRKDEQDQDAMPAMTAFEQLMAQMLAIQQQQAASMQQQAEMNRPKENPNYIARSIFLKPSGEPWAEDLKQDVYLNSMRLNRTPLTQEEVQALNALEPVMDARVVKVDGSMALGSVIPRKDAMGRIDRMTIQLPMKKDDNPQHYPGIAQIATQLTAAAQLATV